MPAPPNQPVVAQPAPVVPVRIVKSLPEPAPQVHTPIQTPTPLPPLAPPTQTWVPASAARPGKPRTVKLKKPKANSFGPLFWVWAIGIAILIWAAVIFAVVSEFVEDHSPPLEGQVATLKGTVNFGIWEREKGSRGGGFEFSIDGRSFFIDGQDWSDADYMRVRSAVLEAEVIEVGLPPEGKTTQVPFWFLIADGRVVQSYEAMLKQHRQHRQSTWAFLGIYGGSLVVGIIVGIVGMVKRRQEKDRRRRR